jgi:ABC-type phosphate transport system ATPase subunit
MELVGLQGLLLQAGRWAASAMSLGRAIVSEAPVCLMDDPPSNLDAVAPRCREIRTPSGWGSP